MSVSDKYGYRLGSRIPQNLKVDASTTVPIEVGDMLTLASAGYVKRASAGDNVIAVAMSRLDTAPSSDGEATILADISDQSIYAYPGASAASQAKAFLTCDVGGARSIDETASTDDVLLIVGVDTANSLYLVKLKPTYAGVI